MRRIAATVLLALLALAAAPGCAGRAWAQIGFPFGSSAPPAHPAPSLPPAGLPPAGLASSLVPPLPPAMMPTPRPLAAAPLSLSPLGAPGGLCGPAVAAAERQAFLPPRLLGAIASVESGRRDPASGRFAPWPWTVNAEGQGYFFETKAQAVAAVRDMLAHGIRSIDVGCMQVNLMHHPDAFASLEAAFDPQTNAAWAARFLAGLFAQAGSWAKATGLYHSATPDLAADYQRKVQAALSGRGDDAGPGGGAPVWATTFGGAGAPGASQGGGGLVRVPQALLPPRQMDALRVVLRPTGAPPGRDLAAYRAAPVGAVARPWRIQTGG